MTSKEENNISQANVQSHGSIETPFPLAMIDNRTSSDNISSVFSKRIIKSRPKICHAKSYALLRMFIEHVGIPTTRSCYKLQPHRHAIDTKLMNWLLLHGSSSINKTTGISECWVLLEKKLEWLLPILRRCNGNVNYADEDGQTILHVFVHKYVGAINNKSLPREILLKMIKLTKKLLEQGASVNAVDNRGNTPMHFAAQHKLKSLITLLLKSFTNVNAQNSDGNTVLHILADSYGSAESFKQIIYMLLSKGADPNIRNNRKNTPVHFAAKHCQLETLDIFKKFGADFLLLGEKGKNMLQFVSSSSLRDSKEELKKMKTIDFFISESCDVNGTDEGGFSVLHYAATCYGNNKIIQKLIKLGANVKSKSVIDEETPLHMAVKCDCTAIETLLKAGADVNAMTVRGITPLHYTIIYGSLKNMECLIRNGADIHRRGKIFDLTPVHMTALACNIKKLDLLISNGADVNVTTSKGITTLHLAAMMGNVGVIDTLLKHGVDVNCRDEIFGSTPLHWAAMKGGEIDMSIFVDSDKYGNEKSETIEYWKSLFAEAFTNQTTLDGLRKAKPEIRQSNEVIKMFLDKGALMEIKDKKGHTPLYYIVENDNIDDLKLMLKHGVDINDDDISEQVVRSNGEVKHHVLWHAMKLKQISFAITSRYKFRTYHTDYWCEYRKCLDEVVALKNHTIGADDKISLYDFLHMNPTSRYVFVENVLLSDPGAKYPWYYDIIMASCREAVDRKSLMKPAKLALRRLSGLPQLCIAYLLSYLNNEMLKIIIYVAPKNEAKK